MLNFNQKPCKLIFPPRKMLALSPEENIFYLCVLKSPRSNDIPITLRTPSTQTVVHSPLKNI